MGINITRYVNNQFEPKRKASGLFTLSADQATVAQDDTIEIDTISFNHGIDFDSSNSQWTLKKGKSYRLKGVAGGRLGSSTASELRFYNVTDSEYFGESSYPLTTNYSSQDRTGVYESVAMITPTQDTIVDFRVEGGTTYTSIYNGRTFVYIEETDSYETPNTYPFEVNADRYDISSFCSGTNITVNEAFAIYGKTKNGYWYVDLFLDLTTTSGTAFTLTISNLTFEENTNQSLHTGSYEERAYLTKNDSDISLDASSNNTDWILGGRVLLKEKPTSI